MIKIGFCGLGVMGLPMAINLIKKSGQCVTGFDILKAKSDILKENGGIPVYKAEEIYRGCDIIFLCLPTNDLTKDNIQKIIEIGRKGTIIIDLGSTAPDVIRDMYKKASRAGIKLLDSPVSGGEAGAIAGTLVLMCGGDREVFEEVKHLLLCMGSTVTYMGPSGCGSVAKLANNMIVGCNIAAVAEAFAFATKAGLDPQVLFMAIKDGFAGSTVLSTKIPKILKRDFSASARIAVHQKDLKNAIQLAYELGIKIPISEMVLGYMNEMDADGKINEDHCAIAKIYEKRMGVEIKSSAENYF